MQYSDGIAYIPVYMDETGQLHGICPADDFSGKVRECERYAEEKLQDYIRANGQICNLQIRYCLEYRIPEMILIHEEDLAENLVDYCKNHGHEISWVSFSEYYQDEEMDTYTRQKLFPYIEFEDGIEWNVPYDKVTIQDFLRTFPEAREHGISVEANNMGGAGDDIARIVLQSWQMFCYQVSRLLNDLDIHSFWDVVDWAARIQFTYQTMVWLKKSFDTQMNKKPSIHQLQRYVKKSHTWNLSELSAKLHAEPELIRLVAESAGYRSEDGELFVYNRQAAEQMQAYVKTQNESLENQHGTRINCRELNKMVDRVNADLLYCACIEKEAKREKEEFQKIVCKYSECLQWDCITEEVKIKDPLPDDFTWETEEELCRELECWEEKWSS